MIYREFWLVQTETTCEVFTDETLAKEEAEYLKDTLAISVEVIRVREVSK